jgi:hypothetical protein
MTYDLAVWEGARPASDAEGSATFETLYAQYIDQGDTEPTPAIRGYVEALLARWIDMTDDEQDVSPWADGPLIRNASGPIIYFAMRPSVADEVSAAAARMAAERGLVCFDPQRDQLRPAEDE